VPAALRQRDGEPTFDEPWQAQLMALASGLIDRGAFTAAAFSEELGAELRRSAESGEPDSSATYYACALRALERLTLARGLVEQAELASAKRAWAEAYEKTPHGDPVESPAPISND